MRSTNAWLTIGEGEKNGNEVPGSPRKDTSTDGKESHLKKHASCPTSRSVRMP
jgi:hypothetical protein